jgi:hypothetical protein
LDRAIANTGGPWELAGIIAFIVCFFHEKKKIFYFFLAFIILILTQSRITFIGAVIILFFWNIKKTMSLLLNKYVFISAVLSIFVLSVYYSSVNDSHDFKLLSRIESFMNNETIADIEDNLYSASIVKSQSEYFDLTYDYSIFDNSGDMSAYIRFLRWSTLIKTTNSSIDSFLFGLGPSFAGKAVDGYYTRLFAETGVIGLMFFTVFLHFLIKKTNDKILKNFIHILIITACVIDIFVTHKVMFLLWLYYGMYVYKARHTINRISK